MRVRLLKYASASVIFVFIFSQAVLANEVTEKTGTRVVVRNHPKTGKPFISIVPANQNLNSDFFSRYRSNSGRPDYRMLDPNTKTGEIPYNGPSSDRKKVYILAASLATIGVVGGTSIIAAAPAATGAGAAGGAGLYGAAGTAIAAGSLSASLFPSRVRPEDRNFTHVSESHAVKEGTVKQG